MIQTRCPAKRKKSKKPKWTTADTKAAIKYGIPLVATSVVFIIALIVACTM